MTTAAPSKATGGGAGHARSDPASRFIYFNIFNNFSMFCFNNLDQLIQENLV
jgi:hypothetical protein